MKPSAEAEAPSSNSKPKEKAKAPRSPATAPPPKAKPPKQTAVVPKTKENPFQRFFEKFDLEKEYKVGSFYTCALSCRRAKTLPPQVCRGFQSAQQEKNRHHLVPAYGF